MSDPEPPSRDELLAQLTTDLGVIWNGIKGKPALAGLATTLMLGASLLLPKLREMAEKAQPTTPPEGL